MTTPENSLPAEIAEKEAAVRSQLRDFDRVIVAWSGGVDSTLVAYMATEELGVNAFAVTSASVSLKRADLELTKSLAREFGLNHRIIFTDELSQAEYRANPINRCFYCKTSLYTHLESLARELDVSAILNGTNIDDLGDHRPGLIAADNFQVYSPLADQGFTKSDIRILAAYLGLSNAQKPQAACLASRVPYGSHITEEILRQIENAESELERFGFTQFRVRHHDDVARLELDKEEMGRALELGDEIQSAIKACGYRFVALELGGFRSGSLNEGLIQVKHV